MAQRYVRDINEMLPRYDFDTSGVFDTVEPPCDLSKANSFPKHQKVPNPVIKRFQV